jgi:hypothetical protein
MGHFDPQIMYVFIIFHDMIVKYDLQNNVPQPKA